MRTHRDIWLATSIAALSFGAWIAFCWPASDGSSTPFAPGAPATAAPAPPETGLEDSLAAAELEQALVEAEPTAAMLESALAAAAAR